MAIGEARVPPLVLTRSGNAGRARSRSSQPFEKAPRSIVNSVYDRDGRMSSQKSVKLKDRRSGRSFSGVCASILP